MSVYALVAGVLVLVLDQASKQLILGRTDRKLGAAESWLIHVVNNARGGTRLLANRYAFVVLWAFAVTAILLLTHFFAPFRGSAVQIAIGAAIGGAAGNLCDVLRHGAVVDFIDLRVWPIFNIADVAIVAGVTLTVWYALN